MFRSDYLLRRSVRPPSVGRGGVGCLPHEIGTRQGRRRVKMGGDTYTLSAEGRGDTSVTLIWTQHGLETTEVIPTLVQVLRFLL